MNWIWVEFAGLTVGELYAIMRLRQQVFVREQLCAFVDCDNLDESAAHLLGYEGDQLQAYLRMHAPGVLCEPAVLSRVVVAPEYRRSGTGTELMQKGLDEIQARYAGAQVRINAQMRLKDFYRGVGFEPSSAPFLEDDIVHLEMIKGP